MDLKPDTVYTVSHDVLNPMADRRQKYAVGAQATIRQGWRFVYHPGNEACARHLTILDGHGLRGSIYPGSHKPLFDALAAALVEAPPSLNSVLAHALQQCVRPEDILMVLLDQGFISLSHVQRAVAYHTILSDAELDELRTQNGYHPKG